ncbi:MAG: alpha/beta hydrolase [Cyanobacteria bacterium P01_A01_bin.114]
MASYTWQTYRCGYEVYFAGETTAPKPPLLLIHPIGVGLGRQFWHPLVNQWQGQNRPNTLYAPDLLGCGDSDMPHAAYRPQDWAAQLSYFLTEIVQQPAIVVVQGALLPVAVRLCERPEVSALISGLVLSGPPAWSLMTQPTPVWRQRVNWNLFDSPLGWGFYQYARRRAFLASFSTRQLFDRPEDVTDDWLTMLDRGAQDMASRHAVFSFLAGFWRQDYGAAIATIQQPTLVIMGEAASSIDRTAKGTLGQERLKDYLNHFPNAQGVTIEGRNVLPYESTQAFIQAIVPFIENL